MQLGEPALEHVVGQRQPEALAHPAGDLVGAQAQAEGLVLEEERAHDDAVVLRGLLAAG